MPQSGQPPRPKEHNRTANFAGVYQGDGPAGEVQSLEERVESIENALHAGNLSLRQVGEATLANTITVMSIDYSSGTTGKYFSFDRANADMNDEHMNVLARGYQ